MSDSDEYLYDQDFEEESSIEEEQPNLKTPIAIQQENNINQSLSITNQNTTHSQKQSNSFVHTSNKTPNQSPQKIKINKLVDIYMKDNPNKQKYLKQESKFDTPQRTLDISNQKQQQITPIIQTSCKQLNSKNIFQQNKIDLFQQQRIKLQQQESLLKQQKIIFQQQADFHKKLNQQIQNQYNHYKNNEQEIQTINQSTSTFYAKANLLVTNKKLNQAKQSNKPQTNNSNRTSKHHKTFNNPSTQHETPSTDKKRPISFKNNSPSIYLIPEIETVTAKCWAILDAKSGQLIYGKNQNIQREVASITKIMTCWVSLQLAKKLNLNHISTLFRVSNNASNVGGTTANLCRGDLINLRDLLYGLMLPSGNDAAVTLAENFTRLMEQKELLKRSGSMNYFIQEMNKYAKDYNLTSTQYANPHGLMNQFNYSTAFDVGQLACITTRDPHFCKLVNTKIYFSEIEDEDQCSKEVFWENTNKLLYKGFAGVKTGITTKAGPCVVEYYKDEKQELIFVLLCSKSMDERWVDIMKLFNWVKK